MWTSLAHDYTYLSIMASSVSSERAFSQGGITISKQHNQLKGDIIEALQCVNCCLRHELIFREPGPLSTVEMEMYEDDESPDDDMEMLENIEDDSWDAILLEDNDEDFEVEIDSDG